MLNGGGGGARQVRDNGVGIPRAEVALAVSPYYTSKLQDFAALETLQSYGFRYVPPWAGACLREVQRLKGAGGALGAEERRCTRSAIIAVS